MNQKKWQVLGKLKAQNSKRQTPTQKSKLEIDDIIELLLKNRGLTAKKDIKRFLNPPDPYTFTSRDVEIDSLELKKVLIRIEKAIKNRESIVVYADYDADGVTAGAVIWETLHALGANVMPYIPHRVEEGYGLSVKGIDKVRERYDPQLVITVDHGITAWEKVDYAKKLGIDIIVTDHHVKPKKLPKCLIIHTTELSGAGIAWFVAKELLGKLGSDLKKERSDPFEHEIIALAAIGTIADMVPLQGANRSIAKYGLQAISSTQRVGLNALIKNAGLTQGDIEAYHVSHILAPRLNAMGRIEHAMDALRLLCTKKEDKAKLLAETLGLTNRERQQLTEETASHAKEFIESGIKNQKLRKLLFVSHGDYNQGVIGLVAGRLVETYYRPAIVVARGEKISKASARSVSGFNIIEAIRNCMDILVDAGGHPMAAGFTVETTKLELLQKRLEQVAERELDEEKLTRVQKIDVEIPLNLASEELWKEIQEFQPFGMGNPEPVFATRGVVVKDARLVGKDGKHLKLTISSSNNGAIEQFNNAFSAIGFGLGELYSQLFPKKPIDIAYTIDLDTWNGNRKLQLKLKDVRMV